MNCRNAYAQGYATLSHKVDCLPHTGFPLTGALIFAGVLGIVGLAMLIGVYIVTKVEE